MYEELKRSFSAAFGRPAEYVFSAPGRTELGGNHTDHQGGRVLAAAVDADAAAAVAENGDDTARVLSDGYPPVEIGLKDLSPRPEEAGTPAALVRGVLAGFAARGFVLRGFDTRVSSRVAPGSGLSSSAAFEVLLGTVADRLCGCGLAPAEIARIGQYAENGYFGKPCGLMDQLASAAGGIISVDFADETNPLAEKLDFDFQSCGHALCIIDSGADHAGLTADYAAVPEELGAVCRLFGRERLREVDEAEFFSRLTEIRAAAGDRAVLRAMHVFAENRRAEAQARALKENDFPRFLALARESGRSSWMYLQNVIPAGRIARQELAFALAAAERLLRGRGACRVHGGGFAGTIQAFVPLDLLDGFQSGMEAALGAGCCRTYSIRNQGGALVEIL